MPIHDWAKVEDGVFHFFHMAWMLRICELLNDGTLPADFYAVAEQDAGPGIPDVIALQRKDSITGSYAGGGTALAEVAPKVRFRDRAEVEQKPLPRTRRIAVRHVTGDKVVAFMEIVSPGNKSGRRPIRQFIQKSTAFIEQNIHLLVLDLFPPSGLNPQGLHPLIWSAFHKTAFKLPKDKPLTLASYNADVVPEAFVEPVAVGDRLPKMPLFLTTENYINVPLEPSYQSAWNSMPKRWRELVSAASKKGSR